MSFEPITVYFVFWFFIIFLCLFMCGRSAVMVKVKEYEDEEKQYDQK